MTKKERVKLDVYYMRKYGYDFKHYENTWIAQGRRCALCKRFKKKDQKRFAQDHNHKRKDKINRGIVCYYCNKYVIGRHDLDSATRLFHYMMKYEYNNG